MLLLLLLTGCLPEALWRPLPARPVAAGPLVRLAPVATGLDQPLGLVAAPDDSERLFVLEKGGTIRVIEGGRPLEVPFLDLRDQVGTRWEGGLLGMAFEPGRPERFYLNYTDEEGDSVIARFRVSESFPNAALRSSEEVLLRVEQPEDNHNGGNLLFGPDGYLWIGLGDGGGAADPFGNGQNPHSLLATLLRLDVSPESGYRVPPDNPFAQDEEAGAPAVWATGLRNPWRFSFDRATGDLWIADVGQWAWEEINQVPAGAGGLNFGWPILEGNHCFQADACERAGLVLPVAEYSHREGCAVTGGHVYRGRAIPALQGRYLFGDFCTGKIWAIPTRGPVPRPRSLLLDSELSLTSFGERADGELYLTDYDGGLFRLEAAP